MRHRHSTYPISIGIPTGVTMLGFSAATLLIFISLITLTLLGTLSCTRQANRELDEGLNLYRQNRLQEALPFFELAVQQDQQNSDAYAWLAETYRRLERAEDAIDAARKAIEIDSCSSFAHTVMADVFNSQYGSWQGINSDSTWNHLCKAVACDPRDGNAWLSIWSEAIRRGELSLKKKALHQMVKTGFLTSAVLSYNRWMLGHLPENALLLTNGDMDTYPAVAIQEVERFRQDVVVVNNSLLNTPWYARHIRDRYEMPLPFGDTELDSLSPYQDENGKKVLVSEQIFRGWQSLQRSGAFSRPIAVSVTIAQDIISRNMDHLRLAGAFWLWSPHPVETTLDTAMIQNSLLGLVPEDFAGSFVSSEDRSPVRRKYSNGMVRNVTSLVVRYSDALIKSERKPEALKMLSWAEQFESKTELGPFFTQEIEKLKKAAK